jgi:hypothetical protein
MRTDRTPRHSLLLLRRLFAAVVLCASATACAQRLDVPEGWVAMRPAEWNSSLAECLNRSPDEWAVSLRDSSTRLTVTPHHYAAVNDTVPVRGGLLIGWSMGEFGGGVAFQPSAGALDTLIDDNLRAFVQTPAGIRAFVGLAHLSLDRGAVYAIAQDPTGNWSARQVADLGSAPHAVHPLSGDSVLVLTSRSVLVLAPDHRVRTLITSDDWWPLSGNSLVRDTAGNIAVGMRGAIAVFQRVPTGYRERWFAPTRCDESS